MIKKHVNFYLHLIFKHLNRMNSSCIDENYKSANIEKNNINDVLVELKDYLYASGYKYFQFKFKDDIITKDEFNRLENYVNDMLNNSSIVDPITEFVNMLKNGGTITKLEDIQFYINNKTEIEIKMKENIKNDNNRINRSLE